MTYAEAVMMLEPSHTEGCDISKCDCGLKERRRAMAALQKECDRSRASKQPFIDTIRTLLGMLQGVMPDTYFAEDSRIKKAHDVLEKARLTEGKWPK